MQVERVSAQLYILQPGCFYWGIGKREKERRAKDSLPLSPFLHRRLLSHLGNLEKFNAEMLDMFPKGGREHSFMQVYDWHLVFKDIFENKTFRIKS